MYVFEKPRFGGLSISVTREKHLSEMSGNFPESIHKMRAVMSLPHSELSDMSDMHVRIKPRNTRTYWEKQEVFGCNGPFSGSEKHLRNPSRTHTCCSEVQECNAWDGGGSQGTGSGTGTGQGGPSDVGSAMVLLCGFQNVGGGCHLFV